MRGASSAAGTGASVVRLGDGVQLGEREGDHLGFVERETLA